MAWQTNDKHSVPAFSEVSCRNGVRLTSFELKMKKQDGILEENVHSYVG